MTGLRALDKKLLRDLRRLWPQVIAIALVMAAGVATYVLSIGSYRSLEETRATYYDRYLFGNVFADVRRAPDALGDAMRQIEGVAAVETRVMKLALLDVEHMVEPATAMLVSLPHSRALSVNKLHLRTGRLPQVGAADEALVSQQFAAAHRFKAGDKFAALINGRKRTLTIVGTALSPEFVYPLGPGELMPNPRRYGIVWMDEDALTAAFDLEGAFSNVALRLRRGGSVDDVMDHVDDLLEPYGGTGAYARKDQVSNMFLDAELKQLRSMSRMLPPVFLLVAAFLVNMTMSRLVALEREQIGLLKALGYRSFQIATHYLLFVSAISVLGVLIGIGVGTWLGVQLTRIYGDFFYFPFLVFARSIDLYVVAALITIAAAMAGALRAVWSVVGLAPAVAMSPPAPPRYRSLMGSLWASLRPPTILIMVGRQLWRFPFRTATSILGVSLGVAVMLASLWSFGSVAFFIDVTFFRSDRQDATINFTDERPYRALFDAERLPGVLRAEPFRAIPARVRHGNVDRRVSITAKPPGGDLSRVLDKEFRPVTPPTVGIALTELLAEILNVDVGGEIEVELLTRAGRVVVLPVTEIIQGYLGLGAYMELTAANRMMREAPVISGVHLALDSNEQDRLFAKVKETPVANTLIVKAITLEKFYETLARNINTMVTIYVSLAAVIAFGVLYNYARISLSERGRELASLRVLGFSNREVAQVVLLEIAIITLLAQPVGWLLGTALATAMVASFDSELYRMPLVLKSHIFAIASSVVIAAAIISAFVVQRRIGRLDLIAVLKTRE